MEETDMSEYLVEIIKDRIKEVSNTYRLPVSGIFLRNMDCIALAARDSDEYELYSFLSGCSFTLVSLSASAESLNRKEVSCRSEALLRSMWCRAYDIAVLEEKIALEQSSPELCQKFQI